MKDISIHDNIVTGYSVSCSARELVLHTVFQDHEPNKQTNVVFHGVEAYHLVGDNMESILLDVPECPIEQILQEFSAEFESGVKYAWPGPWNESPESCRQHFAERKCRGWVISSAYCIWGFVIAQAMELKQE